MKRLLLVLLCLPLSTFAQGGLPTQPYIYVQGKAKLEHLPDLIRLDFTLGARAPDQVKAVKSIDEQAAKVFALLDREKIAENDITAEGLRVQPEFEDEDGQSSDKHRKLEGYHVIREFSVVVRNLGDYPHIIDEVLALGVEEFTNVHADLSDRTKLQEEARDQAMADARAQAERTLQKEHMKIDSLFAVSPEPVPEIVARIAGEPKVENYTYGAGLPPLDPKRYRLAPIQIEQTIHVIYFISPAK